MPHLKDALHDLHVLGAEERLRIGRLGRFGSHHAPCPWTSMPPKPVGSSKQYRNVGPIARSYPIRSSAQASAATLSGRPDPIIQQGFQTDISRLSSVQ